MLLVVVGGGGGVLLATDDGVVVVVGWPADGLVEVALDGVVVGVGVVLVEVVVGHAHGLAGVGGVLVEVVVGHADSGGVVGTNTCTCTGGVGVVAVGAGGCGVAEGELGGSDEARGVGIAAGEGGGGIRWRGGGGPDGVGDGEVGEVVVQAQLVAEVPELAVVGGVHGGWMDREVGGRVLLTTSPPQPNQLVNGRRGWMRCDAMSRTAGWELEEGSCSL